jgi:cytochrome P450
MYLDAHRYVGMSILNRNKYSKSAFINRNWKQKVQAEVASFLSKYTNNLAGTLASQLAEVPVTAWEEEMPALDACIKETQRLVQCNIAMREITSERGEFFQGHHFKKGDCLLYPFSDVHMNPELYKDPAKFDPGRYNGRDDPRSQKFSFIGWGAGQFLAILSVLPYLWASRNAGRHPCLGMRFAKLEIKAIISLFLTGYDYKMVDVNGERLKTFPRADRDDISKTVPLGGPVYFEYSRTEK